MTTARTTIRRPSRSSSALSRMTITAAARRIADSEGIGELTLRRLAAELGTGQASLYRHITDRSELLALLADDLAAGFPLVADSAADPSTTVVRQWQQTHDYLLEHPWGPALIAEGIYLSGDAPAVAAHTTALLRAAGYGATDARRLYQALWHLLLGHLLNAHPLGHHSPDPLEIRPDSDFTWAMRHLLTGVERSRR